LCRKRKVLFFQDPRQNDTSSLLHLPIILHHRISTPSSRDELVASPVSSPDEMDDLDSLFSDCDDDGVLQD